ncbi:MAG TPA: ABC transporter permease [Gemmatimonadaceae bacterium]|nr:ABC transporter permease [Gemmatimonadaceae bacterium]
MSTERRPVQQLHGPIWRASVTDEVRAELDFHVEMLMHELIAAGMTPAAAEAEARRRFGDFSQANAAARRAASHRDRTMRFTEHLAALRQDVVYAGRQLLRAPGFAVVAILTLALGIGANSAIFSVVNAVALKPLAYPQPQRLMFVTSQFPTLGFDEFWVSPPEYFDYRRNTKAFAGLAAYTASAVNLGGGTTPERVNTIYMTANMFDVLGVRPMVGRAFTAEEDLPNAAPVVVLAYELWQRTFGGDPGIVGRSVEIQGRQTRVVGVMPRGFDLHDTHAETWQPLGLDPAAQNRGSHFLYLVGRLAPTATPASANAELAGFLGRWRELAGGAQHVPNDSTHRIQMESLRDEVIGNVRTALWILQGAVGLVLLIACANMANLLLARAESRQKEFAIRSALGAGRGHIVRQFLVEGVVLALLGAVVGLALAYWGLRALLAANPDSIPRAAEIGLDPAVLVFTTLVAVLTGALFGLAPLLHVRERAVASAIREGSTRLTSSLGRNRVRQSLVVGEVALAVMLVVGAGLLLRSFWNLTNVDAGFDRENLVTYGVVLPQATYPEPTRRTQFLGDLLRRLGQIPGVGDVAAMTGLPPSRQVNANDTDFEGLPVGPDQPAQNVDYYQTTTASYFQTMHIPIRQGRGFEPRDVGGPPVVVVNEALAKRFYRDESPIGRRIKPGYGPPDSIPWFTIIGVAADVKQGGLDQPPGTELYLLYDQLPQYVQFAPGQLNVVLRATQPLSSLAPQIRRIMTAMDPSLPIVEMRTMDEVVVESIARQRFLSQLLGIFAAVALLLAAVGTYGILAYMVSERRREIGIRMALGAGRQKVLGLVLRQGLGVAAVGIALGLVGALALSRLAASLLFGVSPVDPLTFSVVAVTIAVVALIACIVPARRATRVDPLVAMRLE